MKAIVTHSLAVLLTLAVVALTLRGREQKVAPQAGAAQGRGAPEFRTSEPIKPPPAPSPESLAGFDSDEKTNILVYSRVNQGVVNITTRSTGGFFGEDVSAGSGSGFVIDTDGHILTNNHVIREADTARVTLFDGSGFDARLSGADESTDLAVLVIQAPKEKLFPLELGDSAGLMVGQKVLAVGNPFGLERTLTTGIISSLDRTLSTENHRLIKGIIQTDAAINPGNSGGPLLNTQGKVIGMNTAIISQVGQSAGIGFAVPINAIKRILDPLIKTGKVVRADIGVSKLLATEGGLLVVSVVEGGPAQLAGLRPVKIRIRRSGFFEIREPDISGADRIVAIDGKPANSEADFFSEIEAHAPGEAVKLSIRRAGKSMDIEVKLGKSK